MNPVEAIIASVFQPLIALGRIAGEPQRFAGGKGQWAGEYKSKYGGSYKQTDFGRRSADLTPAPPPIPIPDPIIDKKIIPGPPKPPKPPLIDGGDRRKQQFGGGGGFQFV